MIKNVFCVGGIVIFILCVSLLYIVYRGESGALSLDDKETRFGMIGEDTPPFCKWKTNLPERVIAEDRSQAVVVHLENPDKRECESIITLAAPGFDTSPVKAEQAVKLPPKGNGSISWIITPRKSGEYEIAVSDDLNTTILVTVQE